MFASDVSHETLTRLLRSAVDMEPPSNGASPAEDGRPVVEMYQASPTIVIKQPDATPQTTQSTGYCALSNLNWPDPNHKIILSSSSTRRDDERLVFPMGRLIVSLFDLPPHFHDLSYNNLFNRRINTTKILSDKAVLERKDEDPYEFILEIDGMELLKTDSCGMYDVARFGENGPFSDCCTGKVYLKVCQYNNNELATSSSEVDRQYWTQCQFQLIVDLDLTINPYTISSTGCFMFQNSIHRSYSRQSTLMECLRYRDQRLHRDEYMQNMKTIYKHVLPIENMPELDFEPPLSARLYPFQKRAVAWMIKREELPLDNVHLEDSDVGILAFEEVSKGLYCNWVIGKCSSNKPVIHLPFRNCRGGILAEEMGLGKTVEVLALIASRPRPPDSLRRDENSSLIPSKATLIITPSAILHQWIDEAKRHAPNLSVFSYGGANSHSHNELINIFQEKDIILTTYDVLRREVFYARPDSDRPRRYERKVERTCSALVLFEFWRVCFDEAQMVENVVSTVAEMASRIPRVNAWAVTGTPIGNRMDPRQDLHGLMVFLNIFPFCIRSWFNKLADDAPSYIRFLKRIMIRHTKKFVEQSNLRLPPQRSSLTLCDFTSIERHFYEELSTHFATEYERELRKRQEDPNSSFGAFLQQWLLRFRHTCCHPQVGAHNQRLFGADLMPLTDVLKVLKEQCTSTVFTLRRSYFDSHIRRGLMHEIQKEWDKAIELYEFAEPRIAACIEEIRTAMGQHSALLERPKKKVKYLDSDMDDDDESDDDLSETDEEKEKKKDIRSRLLSWLSLHHQCLFCVASVYLEMERKEISDTFFQRAENVRREIMGPAEQSVMQKVRALDALQKETDIEKKIGMRKFVMADSGLSGFSSFALGDDLQETIDWLNNQLQLLRRYRVRILEIIRSDLHNEYSKDAEQQDLGHQYQTLYLQALKDRQYVLTGILTALHEKIEKAVETTTKESRGETIIAQEVSPDDKQNVDDFQPLEVPDPLMERNVTPLSMIRTSLQQRMTDPQAMEEEKAIIQEEMNFLSEVNSTQLQLLNLLQRESVYFSKVWNTRIEFYRALQRLSDDVAIPQDIISTSDVIAECLEEERKKSIKIDREGGRLRYLSYLERSISSEDSECGICQLQLSKAKTIAVTECGHVYCELCLLTWTKTHPRCPSCNARILPTSLYRATQSAETPKAASNTEATNNNDGVVIRSFPYPPKNEMPVPRGSFSSKIMTIVSHILYLNGNFADFKCLLFCQWEIVLDLFCSAFDENNLGFSRFTGSKSRNKSEELKRFKTDPSVKVLMLNARSQSAGLTLTNANHVFFVEPSLSQAIELQAAGRVHRLGQTKETWVHRYLVDETVEREIYKFVWNKNSTVQEKSSKTVKNSRSVNEDSLLSDKDMENILISGLMNNGDVNLQ